MRIKAIDALEMHYEGYHKPREATHGIPKAEDAKKRLAGLKSQIP